VKKIRMRKPWRCAFPLSALAATSMLVAASSAQASTVTIGSPLTASFTLAPFCGSPCTLGQVAIPGAVTASPSDGTIVRWRVKSAPGPGGFKLRVLRPEGFGTYTGAGTSAEGRPVSFGTQVFQTELPIHAGDLLGLDFTSSGEEIEYAPTPESELAIWASPLPDGSTLGPDGHVSDEFAFNADVQPLPGISSLSPASGPTAGGTSVTIAGHDFTGATAVSFGGAPAASFTGDSDNQITAVSPPGSPGAVDVSVKNPGQSPTTAADTFTYTAAEPPKPACIVPNLRRKTLKGAKKALKRADCRLGKVRKPKKGAKKRRKLKVKKQSPKAGTVRPAGAKVNVKLG
jgi:IPT/TIG domain/PASTA domain